MIIRAKGEVCYTAGPVALTSLMESCGTKTVHQKCPAFGPNDQAFVLLTQAVMGCGLLLEGYELGRQLSAAMAAPEAAAALTATGQQAFLGRTDWCHIFSTTL